MEKKKKEPATLLRIANLLTILIIILATATSRMGETSMFRRVLFAFHMPLLFLLSGMVLEMHQGTGREGWAGFLRHIARSLVIPYILWALIYSSFSYKSLGWVLYGSYQALGLANTLNLLWFLSCLFIARILTEPVLVMLSKGKLPRTAGGFAAALVSFAIGLLLPKVGDIGYPWCLNVAFVAAGFILLGHSIRGVVEVWAKKPVFVLITLVLSAAIFYFGTIFRGEALEMVFMRSGDFGSPLWFFINALSGSVLILSLSALISRPWKKEGAVITEKDETGIDRVTLGTFVIHMPLLQQVILPLLALLPFALPPAVIFIVGMVVTKLISGVIIKIVARYVPQLFGIYS